MKRALLLLIALMISLSLASCAQPKDNTEAINLNNEILTIGEVSLNSENLIISLENKYATLADDDKSLITNYSTLTNARNKLNELKKVQSFAEKLSLCFAEVLSSSSRNNLKINNCWYYFDGIEYFFTYYISTMSGSGFDYQYWGTPQDAPWMGKEFNYYGIFNLSDEEAENAIASTSNFTMGYFDSWYWAIQKYEKHALREGGIELDAEAIQNYYMRYSD